MRVLYHGTTWENFRSIMKHGFNPNKAKKMTWNVSENDCMYFLDWDAFMWERNQFDLNDIDPDYDNEEMVNYIHDEIVRYCIWHGGVTGTTAHVDDDNRLVVFRLLIPTELEDIVYSDYSCSYDMARQVYLEDLSLDLIQEVYVCDDYYDSDFWFMFHDNINYMANFDDDELEEIRQLRAEHSANFRYTIAEDLSILQEECTYRSFDWKKYLEV